MGILVPMKDGLLTLACFHKQEMLFIILMNRSNAFPVYRDLLCDFVSASTGANWKGFCQSEIVSWNEEDNAFVDNLFANGSISDPATTVLVATQDGAVYQKVFGSRNLEDALPAEIDTPFYVASLEIDDFACSTAADRQRSNELFWIQFKIHPDLADSVRNATIDQLLSHTSGIPDYYSLIDWNHYDGMDNSKVIKLLETKTSLDFPPVPNMHTAIQVMFLLLRRLNA